MNTDEKRKMVAGGCFMVVGENAPLLYRQPATNHQ
jgi:hypothetical protein